MTAPTITVTVPAGPVINLDPVNGVKVTSGNYNATLNSGYFEAKYTGNANAHALLHPFQFDLQYDTGKYITMTALNGSRAINITGNNGLLQVDIYAGAAPYMNLVGGEYRVSGVAAIDSSRNGSLLSLAINGNSAIDSSRNGSLLSLAINGSSAIDSSRNVSAVTVTSSGNIVSTAGNLGGVDLSISGWVYIDNTPI